MSDTNVSTTETTETVQPVPNSASDLVRMTPCTARHYSNRALTLLSKIDDLRTACLNYDLGANSDLVEEFENSFDDAAVAIGKISDGLKILGDRDQASGIREQRKLETMAKRAKLKEINDAKRRERQAKREELKATQLAEREAAKAAQAARKGSTPNVKVVGSSPSTPPPALAADEPLEVPADTAQEEQAAEPEVQETPAQEEHRTSKKHKKAANA